MVIQVLAQAVIIHKKHFSRHMCILKDNSSDYLFEGTETAVKTINHSMDYWSTDFNHGFPVTVNSLTFIVLRSYSQLMSFESNY